MFIVTAKEMYDIDKFAMQEIGLDGKLLMENAGRAVAEKITAMSSKQEKICVLAGAGNNGGDGFVIARTMMDQGYHIHVLQVVPDSKIRGDASFHKRIYENCGGSLSLFDGIDGTEVLDADIIIDAMIGIGVKGELREPLLSLVSLINQQTKKVISVDVPSGLPADEGTVEFSAVEATYTFIIGAPKISAFLNHTSPYYGTWELVSIGLPKKAFQLSTSKSIWNETNVRDCFPGRKPDDHKGTHGKGLVIGGCTEMPGALSMTLKAALRAGAGLITGATSEHVINRIASTNVEATYAVLSTTDGFINNDSKVNVQDYDAIALGMGMGRKAFTSELVRDVVSEANCPIIIDGDGLHHIQPYLTSLKRRKSPTIMTPHPREMAMLLGANVNEILVEPFRYASEFARKFDVYLVLKGMYSIITSPEGKQSVNMTGNPGLAKGGSGDVLTGIILAMIMQRQDMFDAICNACYVHGKSADLLIKHQHSHHDLLASDVIDGIANVYRTIS
ncbi:MULTISPECIES: NAD(P)H-hydrate dehydratase [Virgibacillus]|uniref:Bifunctional NAD(P)H-hydrate repair enzyme n=2 Tax=Virgibacillus TaxID=84406 RepID=A0A024QFD6_9BACI|nr:MULTISPECIES: NAD(P)H-hydrate dehydratase [Virgibacillus]EQB38785.1 hypothetical protein M948_00140 [Virgibacillus sp. CM-4]MYL43861.1 NAD(P)H-hydrate dehydratase [Virgibacillus massiliensis]GGJ66057.1 bifunctional NAD(P)H-hydrate repair enzyme Nnr [Virgibacillus kapii]CDQ40910.1 Nicotinamide nucleotide repair protein [Virgibacillus massiliensis]